MRTFETLKEDIEKKLSVFNQLSDSYISQEGKEVRRVYEIIRWNLAFSCNKTELKELLEKEIQESNEGKQVCSGYMLNDKELNLIKNYIKWNLIQ